jgi:competence protein ComEC
VFVEGPASELSEREDEGPVGKREVEVMRVCRGLGIVAVLGLPLLAGAGERGLDIYWIDVEGGAATLIVTPAGESVLVDAGNPGARDAGRIHEIARKTAGLERIDHVIVTHYHVDHFGGVAELAELMPLGTLWENGIESAPERERNDPRLAPYRAAKVGRRVVIEPGAELPLAQPPGSAPLRLRFLAARQRFAVVAGARPNAGSCAGHVEREPDASDNANSAAMLLEYGAFRFFDGGDLTWNLEASLVCPEDRVGPVDVYQSNHHGLASSNNPVLLRTLQPAVVVFNNGARKGADPPSVAAVRGTPSVRAVYQVHEDLRDGADNTAEERIANRGERCAGHHVVLSVDANGERYSLAVPATGHRQGFETRGAGRR